MKRYRVKVNGFVGRQLGEPDTHGYICLDLPWSSSGRWFHPSELDELPDSGPDPAIDEPDEPFVRS